MCWFTDFRLNSLGKTEKETEEKGRTVLGSVPVTAEPEGFVLYSCPSRRGLGGPLPAVWQIAEAPPQHQSLTPQGDEGSGPELALASGFLGVPTSDPPLGSPLLQHLGP